MEDGLEEGKRRNIGEMMGRSRRGGLGRGEGRTEQRKRRRGILGRE